MWLYIVAVVLAVLGVVGGVASGGIFLIILLPLAAVALLAAIATAGMRRSHGRTPRNDYSSAPDDVDPLPSGQQPAATPAPSSPEAITDARRRAQ